MTSTRVQLWGNCWNCGHKDFFEERCAACGLERTEDPMLEQVLGGATLSELIFAEVDGGLYRAVGANGESLAVRVLPHSLHNNGAASNLFIQIARLLRAQPMAPTIFSVLKHGVSAGAAWMLMDWVEGQSLADLWQADTRNTLSIERAYKLSIQVLDAVAHLHSLELIHARLSPHAFHWVPSDVSGDWVRLLHSGASWPGSVGNPNLPTEGLLERSPWQASPGWQLYSHPGLFGRVERPSVQSDLFSVAVCVYQFFVGRLPYRARSEREILRALRAGRRLDIMPPQNYRGEIGRYPRVVRTIRKALDGRSRSRFNSIKEFRDALKTDFRDDQASNRPRATSQQGPKSSQAWLGSEPGQASPILSANNQEIVRLPPNRPLQQTTGRAVTSAPSIPAMTPSASSPAVVVPQSSPERVLRDRRASRVSSRKGISPGGIRYAELDRIEEALDALTGELLAVASDINPDQSLRVLEEAILGHFDSQDLTVGLDSLDDAPPMAPATGAPVRVTTPPVRASSAPVWSVVCLSSTQLGHRSRSLQGSVSSLYRQALEPVRAMARHVSEIQDNPRRGTLQCILGPGGSLDGVLGHLIVFLMEFERTRQALPPAVTISSAQFDASLVADDVLPPQLQMLAAEARAMIPVTRGGELVARPEVFKALGLGEMGKPLPSERAAPFGPLACWRFAGARD